MPNVLIETIIGYFTKRFDLRALSGDVRFMGGEAFVTIRGVEPSPALHELARTIEHEYDELGLSLRIALRQS